MTDSRDQMQALRSEVARIQGGLLQQAEQVKLLKAGLADRPEYVAQCQRLLDDLAAWYLHIEQARSLLARAEIERE